MARGVVAAAGKQILLDRKLEALTLTRRGAIEARRELFRAPVRRHRERTRQLQTVLVAAALHGELHDAPLHAAPARRHGIGPVSGTDDDQMTDTLRVTLRKSEPDHATVGASRDRPQ